MLRRLRQVQGVRVPLKPSTAIPRYSERLQKGVPRTRRFATVADSPKYPKLGEQSNGFTLRRTKSVPELELTALHFEHNRTGAQYIHIARDDPNNVFSIGFKTNPPDDTGVPHILEHVTLCGSKQYPVRDPFFKMLQRSLSNFMNAFTSSDHTSYPFATTNSQDFKNLMSVYMDATLNPLLNRTDFEQEGWRIGPANPQPDASEPAKNTKEHDLVFKGVVFNEMKGQMSDSSYLFYVRFQDHIFPAINNSGGDPQAIVDLTVEKLRNFHDENYHPTNARLFTYGNFPLQDHLQQLDSKLQTFTKHRTNDQIRRPIDLNEGSREVVLKGPIDELGDPNKQHKTSISWLVGHTSDLVESFSLNILSSLLTSGYASPIYRALIESGLGSDFSPNTGYDTLGKTGLFSIGLTGIDGANVNSVQDTIFKCLETAHKTGFEADKINGILHQLELGLKHRTAQFGMNIIGRLEPGWFNGIDPFDALAWNQIVQSFKDRYAAGNYFENLIEKYLLGKNTFTFTMEPSPSYHEDNMSKENDLLKQKLKDVFVAAKSKEEAIESLNTKEVELARFQEKARHQDLSCLPTLKVTDIPKSVEPKTVRDSKMGSVEAQWRETATNGLTYFRAIHKFAALPDELRMFMPLFNAAIFRIGTKDKTIEQLEDMIKLKTGGISTSYHTSSSPQDNQRCFEGLSMSGFALDSNVADMYEMLRIIVLETDFSNPGVEAQIRELVQSMTSGAMSEIAESGHAYAARAAAASLHDAGYCNELTSGLTQVRLMTQLSSRPAEEGYADVIEKLKLIQRIAIASSSSLRVAITCGKEAVPQNEQLLQSFLDTLPPTSSPAPHLQPTITPFTDKKLFYDCPYQVHYAAKSVPTVSYINPSSAALQVLAQLLTHKHLHFEIREKGGAYGGGMFARGLSGHSTFYSYRDPNPQNTLGVFAKSGAWAAQKQWTDQDLQEAKLGIFQSIDAPQSVNAEGMTLFTTGITHQMEQVKRAQILDVTAQQVRDAAQQYLVDVDESARTCVLGQKPDWLDESWKVRQLAMPS